MEVKLGFIIIVVGHTGSPLPAIGRSKGEISVKCFAIPGVGIKVTAKDVLQAIKDPNNQPKEHTHDHESSEALPYYP